MNSVDITTDSKELFDATLSHLIELNETITELKYIPAADANLNVETSGDVETHGAVLPPPAPPKPDPAHPSLPVIFGSEEPVPHTNADGSKGNSEALSHNEAGRKNGGEDGGKNRAPAQKKVHRHHPFHQLTTLHIHPAPVCPTPQVTGLYNSTVACIAAQQPKDSKPRAGRKTNAAGKENGSSLSKYEKQRNETYTRPPCPPPTAPTPPVAALQGSTPTAPPAHRSAPTRRTLCVRVVMNNAFLGSLGLPIPGEKEAALKRKAEEASAVRAAKKQALMDANSEALSRVGKRIKVPVSAFPDEKNPPECGYWVGKVQSCVDKYSNFWIKCEEERGRFWRPVEEVLKWELLGAVPTPTVIQPTPTAEPAEHSELELATAALLCSAF